MSQITQKLVNQTLDTLQSEGHSADKITKTMLVARMGKNGSNENVYKWLREWKEQQTNGGSEGEAPIEVDNDIATSLEQFTANLNGQFNEKLRVQRELSAKKIDELNLTIDEQTHELKELREFKEKFSTLITEANAERDQAYGELADSQKEVAILTAQVESLESSVREQDETIKGKDKELNSARDQYTAFVQEFQKIRQADQISFDGKLSAQMNEKRLVESRLHDVETKYTNALASNAQLGEQVEQLKQNKTILEVIADISKTQDMSVKEILSRVQASIDATSVLSDKVIEHKSETLDAIETVKSEVSNINPYLKETWESFTKKLESLISGLKVINKDEK